jgi:hypothetical protein
VKFVVGVKDLALLFGHTKPRLLKLFFRAGVFGNTAFVCLDCDTNLVVMIHLCGSLLLVAACTFTAGLDELQGAAG